MLSYFKEQGLYDFPVEKPENWQEAISIAASPLIKNNIITPDYVNEIIDNVVEHGPYIVIMDHVAMPHASADSPGVLGTAISFTKFQEPVIFRDEETGEDKEAELFFTLAASDADEHLQNIMNLSELLMDETLVSQLLALNSEDDFLQLVEEK